MLPRAFTERMERLLGPDEFAAFHAAFQEARTHGLRTNTLKLSPERLQSMLAMDLEPVPWAPGGFYYPEEARPGGHPYHASGLYYIQEPSAMAAAQALAPRPGERVLDLCAAPGGKATHLACLMQDRGLLVANEIVPKRAQVLVENLERFGVTCAVVTQEEPGRLAERFPAFFDRILVDAPCSGEGMFRKLPEAIGEWRPEAPAACALRQEAILDAAVAMLRPGGFLFYSTCTFAPEENEQMLLKLLRRCPDLRVAAMPAIPGGQPARPEWAGNPTPQEAEAIARTVRLWPHRVRGEGHFLALLQKAGEGEAHAAGTGGTGPEGLARADASVAVRSPGGPVEGSRTGRGKGRHGRLGRPEGRGDRRGPGASVEAAVALFGRFCREALHRELSGPFLLRGEALYRVPPDLPDLDGLRVVRPGLHLGMVRKGRFEPAHALALALRAGDARQVRDLPADGDEVRAYLRGETLPLRGEEGWTLVTVDGFPLGWAKGAGGMLKNHYPRGLRWLS